MVMSSPPPSDREMSIVPRNSDTRSPMPTSPKLLRCDNDARSSLPGKPCPLSISRIVRLAVGVRLRTIRTWVARACLRTLLRPSCTMR